MQNKIPGVGTQQHYNRFKIEPIDFIVQNGLDFLQGNVVKYVVRFKYKNGLEDLMKAKQYLEWLIEENQQVADKLTPEEAIREMQLPNGPIQRRSDPPYVMVGENADNRPG